MVWQAKLIAGSLLLAVLVPASSPAAAVQYGYGRYCPEVAREIREGRREAWRERREARRDWYGSGNRWERRQAAREGAREMYRERREARREIRREVMECYYGY